MTWRAASTRANSRTATGEAGTRHVAGLGVRPQVSGEALHVLE